MKGAGRAIRIGAGSGALLFALATMAAGISAGAPAQFLILDTSLGFLFIAAGAVAWGLRPDALTGPILTVSGALWFVGSWAPTGIEPYAGLAWSFERYYDPLLAYLALSFPGRRPELRLSVAVVGLMAAAYVGRTAFRLLFLAGGVDDELVAATDTVFAAVAVAAALVVAVLSARRVINASPAAARVLRPVALAGIVAALSAAYDNTELAYGLATGQQLNSLPQPWAEALSWAIFGLVALVPLGFLVGTVRSRLRHGAIAPLALQLDRAVQPASLERALAHALSDPSLRLYVRDGRSATWHDSADASVRLPEETEERALTLLERDGEAIAALAHDAALREDPALVGAATAVLRLAIENERLTADVRARLDEVRASRARLVEAAQQERTRIERDLHDGAQQRLLSVALKLQEATTAARREAPHAGFVRQLDETSDELMSAIDELRELARGIHPALLTEEGLGMAVTALARRSSVPVELDIALDGRLPPAVEATGYYVVAEALTNVTRHARARSALVSIKVDEGNLRVEVADDGQGGAEVGRGSGLSGLADRLDAVAGRLEIAELATGGTLVLAVIPCA